MLLVLHGTTSISGSPLAPSTAPAPTTPNRSRLSLVRVPVLSKQQTSTLPANGMLIEVKGWGAGGVRECVSA